MNNIGRTLSEKSRKSIDKEFKLISKETKKISERLWQKKALKMKTKPKPLVREFTE